MEFALEVVMQTGGDFVDLILLYKKINQPSVTLQKM